MLPQFELDVYMKAKEGCLAEAIGMVEGALRLSQVRRDWLMAAVLMTGEQPDKIRALERLDRAADHPWIKAEPETLALVALEFSLYGLASNRKAEMQKAQDIVIRLEAEHGDDKDAMQWVARTWLNIGNRYIVDRKWDQAISAYRRVIADQHPDNWCTRFGALCQLVLVHALNGEARSDLLRQALGWIPEERRKKGYGKAAIILARASLAYANKDVRLCRLLAEKARKKAAATASPYTQAQSDLLLLRLAVETDGGADPALLARISDWGEQYPFVPFLASKMLRGEEGKLCAQAASR